jgi:hypothetical protein
MLSLDVAGNVLHKSQVLVRHPTGLLLILTNHASLKKGGLIFAQQNGHRLPCPAQSESLLDIVTVQLPSLASVFQVEDSGAE